MSTSMTEPLYQDKSGFPEIKTSSWDGDLPGIGGKFIYLTMETVEEFFMDEPTGEMWEPKVGDWYTYNHRCGSQLQVEEVEKRENEYWLKCTYLTFDKTKVFPEKYLKPGIKFAKIGSEEHRRNYAAGKHYCTV